MNTTTVSSSFIPEPLAVPAKASSSRCPYLYPNGKRCSLPGLPTHSGSCPLRHSQATTPVATPARLQNDSEDLSADLLPQLFEFSAGTDIRQFLARLLTLVTKGRISPAAPPSSLTSPTSSSTLTAPSSSKPIPPPTSPSESSTTCLALPVTGPTPPLQVTPTCLGCAQTPRPQAPRTPHEYNNLLGESASHFTVQLRDGCATHCAGHRRHAAG
jgi:hypothetical protein